jgi:hypothetical protein
VRGRPARAAIAAFAVACVLLAGLALLARRHDNLRADAGRLKSHLKQENEPLAKPACPAGVAGCVSVSGRVVYVETVDPDGDGDLHVVVADGSVTAPGLTSIKVTSGLRPARNPLVGDRAAAAGTVVAGSHGERQIHALTLTIVPR